MHAEAHRKELFFPMIKLYIYPFQTEFGTIVYCCKEWKQIWWPQHYISNLLRFFFYEQQNLIDVNLIRDLFDFFLLLFRPLMDETKRKNSPKIYFFFHSAFCIAEINIQLGHYRYNGRVNNELIECFFFSYRMIKNPFLSLFVKIDELFGVNGNFEFDEVFSLFPFPNQIRKSNKRDIWEQ